MEPTPGERALSEVELPKPSIWAVLPKNLCESKPLSRVFCLPKIRARACPKRAVFAALRAKGVGWKRIAAEMGVGVGTIYRVVLEG
jgi:hypothetical protein